MPISVPCGKCDGCLLARARDWAIRCHHESLSWDSNCFITLTYAPEHLPANGSLVMRDLQLFFKRLRKRFSSSFIRYFSCGEYGSLHSRPHYHACLFNFDFPDKVMSRISDSGSRCFDSKLLNSIWGLGRTELGTVTFSSASYCARYITKKAFGSVADKVAVYGESVDCNGEVRFFRLPEFVVMSRMPGIARNWFKRFYRDVFPADVVIINGSKFPVPSRYYEWLYDIDRSLFDVVSKARAIERGHINSWEFTADRLRAKQIVCSARLSLLERSYEN